ncbi:MAG: hypothetical protein AAB414_01490 [Patescibacteria group bacterium]
MSKLFEKFWAWYERHYTLNVTIAAILFTLQIVHLYWLTTHVVTVRLWRLDLFSPPPFWETIIIIIDYTEIPAIITTSLVYINDLRKGYKFKPLLYLFFLDIQLLHIFWITDEFVLETFTGVNGETILPTWLAWIAILIDYLELPVIFETVYKALLRFK